MMFTMQPEKRLEMVIQADSRAKGVKLAANGIDASIWPGSTARQAY
jgi:hypothetical protein